MDSEWLSEFGEEYRPHECVLELLNDPLVTDESWHNDVAPHFTAKAGDGQLVELWFYRADASNRADVGDGISNDDTQYHVYLVSDDAFREVAPEEMHTDDAELAVQTFIGLMEVRAPQA